MPALAYRDFFTIFAGTAANWNIDEDFLTITLRDFGYRLNVPLQTNLYSGTGDADGTADLAGKRIPRGWGRALNISAPLLVPGLLIYQVHDGSLDDITAVYDRGSLLTAGVDHPDYTALAAATVTNDYDTCLAAGYFRLAAAADGTVTADIKGDDAGADGYVETTAGIVRQIVATSTVLEDPDDLYVTSFAAVEALQPAPVGYWAGPDDDATVADVIARLMNGIGGWGGFRRNGKFEIGIFSAPAAPVFARYGATDIKAIAREPLPANLDPPPWRWRVGYQRNYTVQSDLAGSVSADRVAFLAEQYRVAQASSAIVKADHPFAQDPGVVESYFAVEADALAEASRLRDLYRRTAALYRVLIDQRGFRRNLGEAILVTYPRFDLINGRIMRIVQMTEDGKSNSVELMAYG